MSTATDRTGTVGVVTPAAWDDPITPAWTSTVVSATSEPIVVASAASSFGAPVQNDAPERRRVGCRIDRFRCRRWERMGGVHCHHETCGHAIFFPAPGVSSAMPFYQRLGDVPRKRHIQFRDNGTLLTEEVMGLEGFTRERVDPLPPPVALPRAGDRRLRADRARGVGAGDAPAPDDAHEGDRGRRRRGDGPAAPDVERRRRDLALPPDRADGLLLPKRRRRRGDLRPRGVGRRSRRSSASCPTRRATTSSSRAARPIASGRRASSAI